MSGVTFEVGGPTRVSSAATTVVKTGGGLLLGFYVASTTSGTIVLYDGLTASGTQISGTITPAVGFHRFPCSFGTGLTAVTVNTIDVTFFWQ